MLASRIILGLTLMLLLVMPLTEQVWSGDEFVSGGPDVELTLLSELAFCGMIALTADQVITSPLLAQMLTHRVRRTPSRHLQRGWVVAAYRGLRCRGKERPRDVAASRLLTVLRI